MSRSMKVLLPSACVFSVGVGLWLRGKIDRHCNHHHGHGHHGLSPDLGGIGKTSSTSGLPVLPTVAARAIVSEPNSAVVPSVAQPSVHRVSEIMKHGFPSLENISSFDDFVLSYDRRNRTANWVFEHLTREKVARAKGINREDSQFMEDEKQHRFHRSRNADYKKSGYDRGHLAAAGNHRWSQRAMDQTFILSNIAPQVGKGFNRDAWNQLEKFVRHLTKEYPSVYVCTGPLYLPRREGDGKMYVKYEVIGSSHVAVPTHFFKVVACESSSGDVELMSFVMPNQVLPENVDLKQYLVPVEAIERASGLLLFTNLFTKKRIRKLNGKKL